MNDPTCDYVEETYDINVAGEVCGRLGMYRLSPTGSLPDIVVCEGHIDEVQTGDRVEVEFLD